MLTERKLGITRGKLIFPQSKWSRGARLDQGLTAAKTKFIKCAFWGTPVASPLPKQHPRAAVHSVRPGPPNILNSTYSSSNQAPKSLENAQKLI